MLILNPQDVGQVFTVQSSAGVKRFLKYQGHFYTFYKSFIQLEFACSFSRICLDNERATIILNQEHPEVWCQVQQPELVRRLNQMVAQTQGHSNLAPLIMYVDDSQLEGKRMGQIVQALGFNYFHVANSVEALPHLLEKKPNLIFLDLVMDPLNGYELCSQLRRISVFKTTPIIIVTGRDTIVDRARAKLTGATQFISKPFAHDTIKAITSHYLAGNQAEPSPQIAFKAAFAS